MKALAEFLRVYEQPTPMIEDCLEALDDCVRVLVRARYVTLMRPIHGGTEAERIYSSDHEMFPLLARKPRPSGAWAEATLDRRCVTIASTPEAMEKAYPDYQRLLDIGIVAIVNVPLFDPGGFRGLLNCMADTNEGDADAVRQDAVLLKYPALLCLTMMDAPDL